MCIEEHTYIWNALEFRSHYLCVYCLSEYVYSLLYRVSIKTSGRTGSTFPDIAHGANSIQSVIDICCKSEICSCFRINIFEKIQIPLESKMTHMAWSVSAFSSHVTELTVPRPW